MAIALLLAPTLRLRGVYFGIVSLALATIVKLVISNLPQSFTGGSMGIILSNANNPAHSYYAMLAVMGATLAVVTWLSASGLGRALKAIRDDDGAAACVGIHVPKRLKAGCWACSRRCWPRCSRRWQAASRPGTRTWSIPNKRKPQLRRYIA